MEKTFRYLLDALGKELGLPEIATAEDGRSALLVIDDFELWLRCVSTGHMLLFTVVAPLPEQNRQKVMAALLDANTFYYQTQGFALGAREDTGVTLQGVIALRFLDENNVCLYVKNFIDVAQYWQNRCQEIAGEGEESPAPLPQAGLPNDILEMLYLRV